MSVQFEKKNFQMDFLKKHNCILKFEIEQISLQCL